MVHLYYRDEVDAGSLTVLAAGQVLKTFTLDTNDFEWIWALSDVEFTTTGTSIAQSVPLNIAFSGADTKTFNMKSKAVIDADVIHLQHMAMDRAGGDIVTVNQAIPSGPTNDAQTAMICKDLILIAMHF